LDFSRVAYKHNFNTDADLDPAFTLNADPYPDPASGSTTICLWTLRGSILSLLASVVSLHGFLGLYFEPLKLLNYDFNEDPDPDLAFQCKSGSSFQK
jgi:hypothetical protein